MTWSRHHDMSKVCLSILSLLSLPVALVTEVSLAQNVVFVDDFGAAGNGLTWDHDAIQAAISGAGQGGTIVFTHGRTYVVCKRIALSHGLHVVGNGATIRRCDRVNTVLVAPALAGDTQFVVENASRYEPGMWVAPILSSTHDGGEFASRGKRNVQEIDGNVIQISDPLRQSYPVGSLVITIDEIMIGVRDDVWIEGLFFDGNRRNNDDWVAWENGVSLYLHGERNVIRNNIFLDCWSTCIDYFGGPADIINNYFQGAASAALHVSSIDSLNFSGNQITGTNTLAKEAGHSEAAITWSAFNKGLYLSRNCIHDSGAGVFGAVNRKWNNDIVIEHNYACGAESFFSMYKDQPAFDEFAHDGHVIVRDNVAVNVGRSASFFGGAAADSLELMRNFSFVDNSIVNGYLHFRGLENSQIQGNRLWMTNDSVYGGTVSPNSSDRAGLITLSESKNVLIDGNQLIGGSKGIYLHNDDEFILDDVSIFSNVILGSEEYGIVTGDLGSLLQTGAEAWKADHSGVIVQQNVVISTSIDDESEAGLITGFGVTSTDNCVETSSVGARIAGSSSVNATGTPMTFHHGNSYLGSTASVLPFDVDYVADVSLADNVTKHPIPPDFDAAGSILLNNEVDSTASCVLLEPDTMPQCAPCALMNAASHDGLLLEIKVLLEGPYVGSGVMNVSPDFRTALEEHAVYQPYGQSHFSGTTMAYWGSEFAFPSFPGGSVDWIVVALRTDSTAGSEIDRRAAILKDDGSVVSPNGSIGVNFPATQPGSYYVVVYHRNHLSVMSSLPVDMQDGVGEWDFRDAANKAFRSGLLELSNGFFGLPAGDGNGDGQITAPDFNQWLAETTAGATGYRITDYNLDGQTTAPDFNLWNANTTAGARSHVPN